jgi:predicted metal-binding membrane protein
VSAVLPSAEASRTDTPTWLLTAIRARIGLVTLLVALAAVAWWSTGGRMSGMDAGPGTPLGALGWFLGIWTVMMAAMMLPAVAPTVALYERMARRRWSGASVLFAAAYLLVWSAAGLLAYGVFALGRDAAGAQLAWHAGGRWVAGGVLVLAAAYELTPLKRACLARCRSPLGFLLGSWRDGRRGAIEMGARHGAWCLGCCWALMAALFALGVMSLTWMALVAALITAEKTLPWGRALTYGISALLLVTAIAVLAAPDAVPGLTVPHAQTISGAMH